MRFDSFKIYLLVIFLLFWKLPVHVFINFCYDSCEGYFEGLNKRYYSLFFFLFSLFFFCLLMYDHFFPGKCHLDFYVVHFACKISTISRFSFTFSFLIAIAQNTFLNRALQKSRIGFFSSCVCIHGVAKSRTRLRD